MERLEWLSIADYASMIGESRGAVRFAIRRFQLRVLGVYKGECWTLYAEKHGDEWRIPVLVRTLQEDIVSVCAFSSRTAYLEWCEKNAWRTATAPNATFSEPW